MPRTDNIEEKVWAIEKFRIVIMQNGADVRGDKIIPRQYEAERMSKNSFTVGEWRAKFQAQFPGYNVKVLNADGSEARGTALLSTVRSTYLP